LIPLNITPDFIDLKIVITTLGYAVTAKSTIEHRRVWLANSKATKTTQNTSLRLNYTAPSAGLS
jgi:hypothetical protein